MNRTPRWILSALLLAFFSSSMAAGPIYSWIDSKGMTHYSDKPAKAGDGVRAERALDGANLDGPDRLAAGRKLANDVRDGAQKSKAVVDTAKASEVEALRRVAQEKACSAAREAVRILETGGRISTVRENGERAMLDEAEVASRAAEARKVADDACAPPKPQVPAPAPAPTAAPSASAPAPAAVPASPAPAAVPASPAPTAKNY